eukprot:scaffold421234_cov59-Attheya_sp.AAC.4
MTQNSAVSSIPSTLQMDGYRQARTLSPLALSTRIAYSLLVLSIRGEARVARVAARVHHGGSGGGEACVGVWVCGCWPVMCGAMRSGTVCGAGRSQVPTRSR